MSFSDRLLHCSMLFLSLTCCSNGVLDCGEEREGGGSFVADGLPRGAAWGGCCPASSQRPRSPGLLSQASGHVSQPHVSLRWFPIPKQLQPEGGSAASLLIPPHSPPPALPWCTWAWQGQPSNMWVKWINTLGLRTGGGPDSGFRKPGVMAGIGPGAVLAASGTASSWHPLSLKLAFLCSWE